MKLERINIFWTGGWDSTFRIIQLAEKKVIIQPYYLKDNRKSEKLELGTIKLLTEEILKLKTTKCQINELISMKVSDVENDNDITNAYNKLKAEFKSISKGQILGSQYEWLARFSKNIDNLELGIEKGSKVIDAINIFGELQEKNCQIRGAYYSINKANSSKDLINVFGNYHYPLLNFSKLKMKQIAEEKGAIDIMNKTWFCHRPKNNKPCGSCNPCMQTIDFGLRYRFDKKSLFNYRIKKIKKSLKEIFKLNMFNL
jgi:7-cyano-7-deazaguanine synthase